MTGEESDQTAAAAFDPGPEGLLSYEAEYLTHFGRSFFELERRHADHVRLPVAVLQPAENRM